VKRGWLRSIRGENDGYKLGSLSFVIGDDAGDDGGVEANDIG
jgi:hypothetical protein